MRQKRAIIFEKLQNFIQNENNSHLVTYESAGFGGFYIKNRFFFQEDFLDINNFDWATFQKLLSKHGFKYVFLHYYLIEIFIKYYIKILY